MSREHVLRYFLNNIVLVRHEDGIADAWDTLDPSKTGGEKKSTVRLAMVRRTAPKTDSQYENTQSHQAVIALFLPASLASLSLH